MDTHWNQTEYMTPDWCTQSCRELERRAHRDSPDPAPQGMPHGTGSRGRLASNCPAFVLPAKALVVADLCRKAIAKN